MGVDWHGGRQACRQIPKRLAAIGRADPIFDMGVGLQRRITIDHSAPDQKIPDTRTYLFWECALYEDLRPPYDSTASKTFFMKATMLIESGTRGRVNEWRQGGRRHGQILVPDHEHAATALTKMHGGGDKYSAHRLCIFKGQTCHYALHADTSTQIKVRCDQRKAPKATKCHKCPRPKNAPSTKAGRTAGKPKAPMDV